MRRVLLLVTAIGVAMLLAGGMALAATIAGTEAAVAEGTDHKG